jgi:CspA family cold shock protein
LHSSGSQHTISPEGTHGNRNREVVQRREGLWVHQADDPGKDLFVHRSAITGGGFRSLAAGAKVSYEIHQGPKGPSAANVRTM